MDPRQRILGELGLVSPEVDSLWRLPAPERRRLIHDRGRRLLAKYHPDRNPGDAEAAALFRLATQVIRQVEASYEGPPAPVVTLVSSSPSVSAGVSAEDFIDRRSARRGYSTFVEGPGIRYDARRAVFIRP